MKQAIVFPGQGAQKVGMGAAFAAHPVYREHLQRADALLGFDLSQLMAEGPAETLTRTDRAQLALFVVSTGIFEVWRAAGQPLPALLAGHSLGEYSALYAAGALSFETALQLVARRGALMQAACESQPGAMAAVIRPDLAALQALCAEQTDVGVANFNGPQQVVLSGPQAALQNLCETIKSRRLGRVVPLQVAGAFHSPLMRSAEQALQALIAEAELAPAAVPVVMNATAALAQQPDEIRAALLPQMGLPVRWAESMDRFVQQGVAQVIECGPATLGPLLRQWPELAALTLENPDQITAFNEN